MDLHEGLLRRAVLALAAAASGVVLLLSGVPAAHGAGTTTVPAAADSYVDASVPATNYGTLTKVRVDSSPDTRSYLRFDLSGVVGSVTHATLTVTPTSSLAAGIDARGVVTPGSW